MKEKLYDIAKRLARPRGDKRLCIGDVRLTIDQGDIGGRQYEGRGSVEELRNDLYPRLKRDLDPRVVVDVGANYGFTGTIFAKTFPGADLILVEPDPRLARYIRLNLADNGIGHYKLVEAICAERLIDRHAFGINPLSSQDNRVAKLDGWKTVEVPTTTLSALLEPYGDSPAFIKIDTQGFEARVFEGARSYLDNHDAWFVKTESAPDWLESQGTRPEELLLDLVQRYRVAEAPARTRFQRDPLRELFARSLGEEEVASFVKHVRELNVNGTGWTDLYIARAQRAEGGVRTLRHSANAGRLGQG